MDVSEISSAFGAYYENAGQNMTRILGMLSQGQVTPGFCTPIKTDDTIFKLSQLTLGKIVQSFQKAWTPKNAAAFTPNELRLYHYKVDEEIFPDDIEATWLGFLAGQGLDKKDWPLIKFLLEHATQGYLVKIQEDMELSEYGKGIYVAPTPGTAGVTGNGMDGLIKQLQDGVNDETINTISIGALAKATIFDQVELFSDGISQVYQNSNMNIFMSPDWVKMYQRDKRTQGFYDIKAAGEISTGIDFTPLKVVGLPSLNGTDTIFATPQTNLLHLTKRSAGKSSIKIEEYRRNVSLLCDWWEGMGFGMNGAVWTNTAVTP